MPAVDWWCGNCRESASAHRSHHLGQTSEGCPAAFLFVCLLFTVLSSGFQLQLTPALMFCCWTCCPFDQVLAKWRQTWIQVTTKFRRMSFGTYYRPSSSKVGRLSEDFAEHPYEVPRIKNAGSSRCFHTEWLQVFRQQCLICEFFHPCFDEC